VVLLPTLDITLLGVHQQRVQPALHSTRILADFHRSAVAALIKRECGSDRLKRASSLSWSSFFSSGCAGLISIDRLALRRSCRLFEGSCALQAMPSSLITVTQASQHDGRNLDVFDAFAGALP